MSVMGDRIHQKRIELNMTMEELGAKVGVQSSAVNKWEKGTVENIKRSTIERLANVFDCDPVWLMGLDVPDVAPGVGELLDLFNRVTPEQRKAVINLLRSFVAD